jgi:hypothetical protein
VVGVESLSHKVWSGMTLVIDGFRGEVILDPDAEALRRYDAIVDMALEAEPGSGLTPWLVLAASASLVAHARRGTQAPDARADELRDLVVGAGDATPEGSLWFTDLPLNGVLLVALASWALRFGPADQHEDAARLLAIARRWAYNRSIPVMAWEPLVELADLRLPGRVERLVAEMTDRPGLDLLPEAADAVARLKRAWITSS